MSLTTSQELGRKFVEALGLDPNRVVSLTITLKPDQLALVTAEVLVGAEQVDGLAEGLQTCMESWELTPKAD